MANTAFCTIALAAAVIGFMQTAIAQNFGATSGECGNPLRACLFYGGDFVDDPFYPPISGGSNNQWTPGLIAYTWVPFIVPAGETWDVRGLFTNNASSFGVLDQGVEPRSVASWSISTGVSAGNAGTVVDSGTSPATST